MPYYVLLVLDDEEQAKDFVAATIAESEVTLPDMATDAAEGYHLLRYPAQVWGAWRKPTEFCTCSRQGGKGVAGGFTREPDYGWWVHSTCGKPTPGWASGKQWFSVLGTTLLPREFQPYPDDDPAPESRKAWRDIIDE